MSLNVSLRPAGPEDQEFLRTLFYIIRAPEFIHSGLTGPALQTLLDQQYKAMRTHYDRVYSDAGYMVIVSNGERIGYFATIEDDSLHLIDISILPEFRNLGIGTMQMLGLQNHAQEMAKPMTLTVEKFNPAMRLYERLGFVPYDESGIYLRMKWTPLHS